MSYGVVSTGFSKKTLSVIKEEIKDDQLDLISAKLNLLDTSVFGQINGIFADKLREAWDVAEAVYRAAYPDSASGAALEEVASITRAERLEATKSTVTLDRLLIDDGVTIPSGSIVSIGSTGARFVTTAAVSNSTGDYDVVSVAAESEDTGPIAGYAGTIDTIQTPISGWEGKAVIQGTVAETWSLDGLDLDVEVDGGATQNVTFAAGNPWSASDVKTRIEAATTGVTCRTPANGTIIIHSDTVGDGSSIQTPSGTARTVLGLPSTLSEGFNSADATAGRNIETDPDFRIRREELLRVTGSATLEAIRAGIRELDDVVQATGFENKTMIADSLGLPPKSFEMVVSLVAGGDQQAVAEAIWDKKPAGMSSYGSTSKTVVDSMGFSHTVKYSIPTNVPIYISLIASVDAATFPVNGIDLIKAALATYGGTLLSGEDVIALAFKSVPLDIEGVLDVPTFTIDIVTPPVGTSNIAISYREQATFDTANMTVTTV